MEANESMTLGVVEAVLRSGSEELRGRATATYRLAPTERVVITFEAGGGTGLELRTDPMTLTFGPDGEPMPVFAVNTRFSSHEAVVIDLVIARGSFTLCRDRKARAKSLQFNVLNFPPFMGKVGGHVVEIDGKRRRLDSVEFSDDRYRVSIRAVPNLAKVIEQLKEHGGNAITHIGRVESLTRRGLSLKDSERVMHDVHRFISFARGNWTSVFGVVGKRDDHETIFEEWGVRPSTQWESRSGWFDTHHSESLTALYKAFTSMLHDTDIGAASNAALYWYLRSNRGGSGAGVDGGIILAQAALERLASAVAERDGVKLGKSKFGDALRIVLKHLGIPTAMPPELLSLRRGKRRGDWLDGPDAVAKVRNELVHPKSRLRSKVGPSVIDTWRLSQWYVELMLLRLSDYTGVYSNRLQARWLGEVEPVPWASKAKKASKP